jgi:hypothetical protein
MSQQQQQHQIKKSIIQYFELQDTSVLDSLGPMDLHSVIQFMDPTQTKVQQLSKQWLQSALANKYKKDNYITLRTKKLYIMLRRSRVSYKNGKPRLDIVQIAVNPLYQKSGVLTRFLTALKDAIPGTVIIIEQVVGPKLLNYIEKRQTLFEKVDAYSETFVYKPSI